jgi:hypothetical protein
MHGATIQMFRNILQGLRPGLDPLVRPKQWKIVMRFGIWKVRCLYRAGSLTAAARELRRYRLGSVGVQEVRCSKGGNVRTEDYTLSVNKASHQARAGFFTPHDSIRI